MITNDLNIKFDDVEAPSYFSSALMNGDTRICFCKIAINKSEWSIVSWYTNKEYMHKGYGKMVMKHIIEKLCAKHGKPDKIKYIWNGANDYVMDWLKMNFEPICMLPLSVQKYSEKDEWDAHVYTLNKNKFLEYFNIGFVETL